MKATTVNEPWKSPTAAGLEQRFCLPISVMNAARQYFHAVAGIVIGSTARGDHSETSDLDLLLITHLKPRLSPFYRRQEVAKATRRISIIVYSPADFTRFLQEGSLFVHHVWTEGAVVWDDGTFAKLRRKQFTLKSDFSDDIAFQLDRLSLFQDPRAFGGFYVYALARLFAIYKNVVFFALAQFGRPEFNKQQAFVEFYRARPDLLRLRPSLKLLEKAYLASARNIGSPPRGSGSSAEQRFLKSVESLTELGRAVLCPSVHSSHFC